MTSDDVAAPVQIADLGRVEEPGSANAAGRDQEVRLPTKLIEHPCDVERGAHSTVVECQQERAIRRRPGKQLNGGDGVAPETLRDGLQVPAELDAIQLIHIRIGALKATRLPLARGHHIVKQECDCARTHRAPRRAARFQRR